VYSAVAVKSAKSNAKRLREQDGGTLDLHRQSLRQHGLLDEKDVVAPRSEVDEAVRKERERRKEELRRKEEDEFQRAEKERLSLWNWVRGK
jgi:hypothetical protein